MDENRRPQGAKNQGYLVYEEKTTVGLLGSVSPQAEKCRPPKK